MQLGMKLVKKAYRSCVLEGILFVNQNYDCSVDYSPLDLQR